MLATQCLRGFFSVSVVMFALAVLSPLAYAIPTELFFSEYIEGTSNNKALEIYNGTGSAIDLGTAGYNVQMFFNGNTSAGTTINLTGTVSNNDVYVLAPSTADVNILLKTNQFTGVGVFWFTGNDTVVLRKGSTMIDVIGQIGVDPGTGWGTSPTGTANATLQRKSSIWGGDTNSADAFDPSIEWNGFTQDTFGGLGTHSVAAPVPIPSTLLLLGSGLVGMVGIGRKRFKK